MKKLSSAASIATIVATLAALVTLAITVWPTPPPPPPDRPERTVHVADSQGLPRDGVGLRDHGGQLWTPGPDGMVSLPATLHGTVIQFVELDTSRVLGETELDFSDWTRVPELVVP